jgi:hypothetical protein
MDESFLRFNLPSKRIRSATNFKKGGQMLHIGHFSFDESDSDQNDRHGYFTCVVDVEEPEDAVAKFAGHLLEMKKNELCFKKITRVYIEDIIKIASIPEEPITTYFQSSEGSFPNSISHSLPSVIKDGINAYGMYSDVITHEKDETGNYLYSKPFIKFD